MSYWNLNHQEGNSVMIEILLYWYCYININIVNASVQNEEVLMMGPERSTAQQRRKKKIRWWSFVVVVVWNVTLSHFCRHQGHRCIVGSVVGQSLYEMALASGKKASQYLISCRRIKNNRKMKYVKNKTKLHVVVQAGCMEVWGCHC